MERIKTYVIIGLSIALAVMIYLSTRSNPVPDDIVVIIPESSNTTGVVGTGEEGEMGVDTVYVDLPGKPFLVVDKEYKIKYERAIKENDSLAARNIFLESIAINETDQTVIDNDEITIGLYTKNRGALLAYKVDYTIKEKEFTYTPEYISVRPRLTMLIGVELALPKTGFDEPGAKLNLGFQGKNGDVWTGGIDTRGTKYAGYSKSFTLFK